MNVYIQLSLKYVVCLFVCGLFVFQSEKYRLQRGDIVN